MNTNDYNDNLLYVNNTNEDLSMFHEALKTSINTITPLPEEISDLLDLTILVGFNPDGSNRGIINWA